MNPTSNERVALITGSTRGIGRAIALRLVREGVRIAVHGRSKGGASIRAAEETLSLIREAGGEGMYCHGDIADKQAVGTAVDAVREQFGRLDILVLNAARAPFKESWKLLERDLRQLVDTNLLGNVFCLQKALPLLEQQGGHVVFLSSLGSRYMNVQYPLGPIKAAMEAMVRQWSEELQGRKIHVNAVCAGLVKTDAFKTLRRIWPELAELPERFFVTPEEVADVVAFLASPAAAAVAGQTLVVDKGLSNRVLRPPE